MLDTHYPQITDNKLNDVEISLQEPISKINLRGKSKEFFAKAGKVLSLILPNEANTSSFSENFNAIWLSPDEWMVYFKNDDEKVFIFNGWTFSSDPNLTPFDHAIYDLQLINCYNV